MMASVVFCYFNIALMMRKNRRVLSKVGALPAGHSHPIEASTSTCSQDEQEDLNRHRLKSVQSPVHLNLEAAIGRGQLDRERDLHLGVPLVQENVKHRQQESEEIRSTVAVINVKSSYKDRYPIKLKPCMEDAQSIAAPSQISKGQEDKKSLTVLNTGVPSPTTQQPEQDIVGNCFTLQETSETLNPLWPETVSSPFTDHSGKMHSFKEATCTEVRGDDRVRWVKGKTCEGSGTCPSTDIYENIDTDKAKNESLRFNLSSSMIGSRSQRETELPLILCDITDSTKYKDSESKTPIGSCSGCVKSDRVREIPSFNVSSSTSVSTPNRDCLSLPSTSQCFREFDGGKRNNVDNSSASTASTGIIKMTSSDSDKTSSLECASKPFTIGLRNLDHSIIQLGLTRLKLPDSTKSSRHFPANTTNLGYPEGSATDDNAVDLAGEKRKHFGRRGVRESLKNSPEILQRVGANLNKEDNWKGGDRKTGVNKSTSKCKKKTRGKAKFKGELPGPSTMLQERNQALTNQRQQRNMRITGLLFAVTVVYIFSWVPPYIALVRGLFVGYSLPISSIDLAMLTYGPSV
ncbi:hypothetical protein ElyMa_000473500 [Elysia marginata]|uniref:G-protein coupled receptors family 1 profile domain-containing protein n=1 Tax=Elysia marginata TaxID=1093978 RepID=A0AAV4FSZ8_9GAST|nr:hypothetical protein ElyMa_000473500 [Elysia marginata]